MFIIVPDKFVKRQHGQVTLDYMRYVYLTSQPLMPNTEKGFRTANRAFAKRFMLSHTGLVAFACGPLKAGHDNGGYNDLREVDFAGDPDCHRCAFWARTMGAGGYGQCVMHGFTSLAAFACPDHVTATKSAIKTNAAFPTMSIALKDGPGPVPSVIYPDPVANATSSHGGTDEAHS